MKYSLLKSSVEKRPIAPIQQQWLDSIVPRVPDELKETPEMKKHLGELCVEVSEEFFNVVVRHTGKQIVFKVWMCRSCLKF